MTETRGGGGGGGNRGKVGAVRFAELFLELNALNARNSWRDAVCWNCWKQTVAGCHHLRFEAGELSLRRVRN
jgi:hypothetical protein